MISVQNLWTKFAALIHECSMLRSTDPTQLDFDEIDVQASALVGMPVFRIRGIASDSKAFDRKFPGSDKKISFATES